MKDISTPELLKHGFADFKKYWQVLLGSFAVIWVINLVSTFLQRWSVEQDMAIVSMLVSLVLLVVQLALMVGLIKIALAVVDGKGAKLDLMWSSVSDFKLLALYVITSFIVGIAIGVGFLLFVIPGFILMVKLAFSLYFVVDKGQSPINAIKSSWDKTKGRFVGLLVYFVVVTIMNVIAAMLFTIPLLVTVPITMVATARLYRKISS